MSGLIAGVAAIVILTVAVFTKFRRNRSSQGSSASTSQPPDRELSGGIDDYFLKISELVRNGHDTFFVIAEEMGTDRFIQVSVGRHPSGEVGYRFDLPVVPWSEPYINEAIETSAQSGLKSEVSQSGPMASLGIDFTDPALHERYARTVFNTIFAVPADAQVKVTWG